MSDDSDTVTSTRNQRKRKAIISDSSDSDSSIESTRRKRKKHKRPIQSSGSDSDSSIDVVHKKRVGRVTSDSEGGSSSGSDIVRNKRTIATLASDSDSSEYDSDWVTEPETEKSPIDIKPTIKNDSSSESGDDQLEKCPICLLSFKNQEVGSPESCDHSFCIDCILEWSKNVNTCPVDRQIFNLILVRSNYNGKIIKQIPIESPQPQNAINDIVEDPTFCEICGSCDREDRMLLCDGCDLGFHLECLNPPLENIPAGLWFCPDCGSGNVDTTVDIYEVHLLLEDAETLGWPTNRPANRNTTPRLVPRTRQTERVRARVITHRTRQRNEQIATLQENERNNTAQQPGPSVSSTNTRNRQTNQSSRSSRKKRKRKKPRIKITYEFDEVTGEKIAIETKIKRKRKRKQTRRARMVARVSKSVKGRLAMQLGMCKKKVAGQQTPDVRLDTSTSNSIGYQRSQAGIPALHLFGRNELDYYGGTDSEEDITNGDVMIRRRPQPSDVSLFRRAARQKAIIAPPIVSQQTSPNILDSILDIQSKFHSKNSVMSLNNDGTVHIDSKEPINNKKNNNNNNSTDLNANRNRNRINLNDYTNAYFRQTPMYGNGSPTSPTVYGNDTEFSRRDNLENRNAVSTSSEQVSHGSTSSDRDEDTQNYSLQRVCSSYDYETDKKEKDKDKSRSNTPGTQNSDSELDIYSDIETVSTSRAEEYDVKSTSPAVALTPNTPTDEEGNNSDVDLIIDTEKVDDSKEQVSSTVDLADPNPPPLLPPPLPPIMPQSPPEIQNQTVQSTNSKIGNEKDDKDLDEDEDSEDGCPNFSIYSSESINIAKTTDLQLLSEQALSNEKPDENNDTPLDYAVPTIEEHINSSLVPSFLNINESIPRSELIRENNLNTDNSEMYSYSKSGNTHCGLYSDSDDETLVKINKTPFGNEEKGEERELNENSKEDENNQSTTPPISDDTTKNKTPFALGDISNMTEDISEEERSYTPCLDERTQKQGLEGLDTEMISDEDRNDFDESHDLKTASDGDALEINAKESELDFSKPEDYEEGEIVDKNKQTNKPVAEQNDTSLEEKEPEVPEPTKKPENKEKDNEPPASFKKLSKNNKERNYRDKDKENARSKSKERKSDKESRRDKKKEKRKELERYNVRSMIADKPRRNVRDKFGRDESRRRSPSRSSRSLTPPVRRSASRARSYSRERAKKRRARTKSKSRTPTERRRTRSPRPRRQKSLSRERYRRNWRERSKERYNSKSRQSASPRRRREWVGGRRSSKGWSRSVSRSFTPEQRLTPSWTPPRLLEAQPVKPQNLTVILNNDHNKKKKEKRKKVARKENDKGRKRKRNRTPPPSKEVFASGNNILVSVSFNKDKNQRDVINKRKRDVLDDSAAKKGRKVKDKRPKTDNKRKKKKKDLSGVKPVAIIDLDRSPFREVTPSPEDVIVLTDSENAESNDTLGLQKAICDSSQQVASPERSINTNYLTGPKTPPEPQVKFTLNPKQTQIRAISNPLHEPDELDGEIDPQEELEQRLNDSLHKGPNTPPEPPNSPPSSPDVYDPFEPTKSRSPTPEPIVATVQLSNTSQNDSVREESLIDSRNDDDDETIDQSHTPPVITDIQPADSQCSNIKPLSPEKSPEQHIIGVVINRVVQSQAAIFPTVSTKTIQAFTNPSLVTSTPIVPPRINILNSTVLTPTTIASSLPQRIVLPNTTKSSPVKVSPNKLPIKSTPIKPMPAKNLMNKSNKSSRKSNGNENVDTLLDFESPYSPGSSDYEDLFEPPTQAEGGGGGGGKNTNKQSGQKISKDQTTFDILFGSSPVNNNFKTTKSKPKGGNSKYKKNAKGTKQVGVKVDEDTLKILDELPNSAVEMQVKYKYLKKLNRQERVVEEVKLVLKPHYNKKHINKDEYKDILRRAVPKICHNKSGEINPQKIQNLIEAYVKKIRHSKKVTSSSSVNPQKA